MRRIPRAIPRAVLASLHSFGLFALGAYLLLSSASRVAAQEPTPASALKPDSASMAQALAMANQMGPMYEMMMQGMMNGTLKALERPENVLRMAAFMRRYYEALVKQGFSKEESLR